MDIVPFLIFALFVKNMKEKLNKIHESAQKFYN